MRGVPRVAAVAALAFGGALAVPPDAGAHGWHRHHRHALHRHHHPRGWVHDYGPRYYWSAGFYGWPFGCGVRRFVTYYGALAYREVCD